MTPRVSIVSPAYREAANLPAMHERLSAALAGVDWEWIVVDDHSPDDTFGAVQALARRDTRVRGARLSRNFGSHMAILCGLSRARGACAVAMAADLQDPPETLPRLLAEWERGAKVVWAARRKREGVGFFSLLCSRAYWFLMRRFVGLQGVAPEGADFVLLDRAAIGALLKFPERHTSVFGLMTWMGFPQATVLYDKQARLHGVSGWTLEKKLKLALDSFVSFSYKPIRLLSAAGALLVFAGAAAALAWGLRGRLSGAAALGCLATALSGLQLLGLGVLGEYVWRALDEARRRPPYIVEAATDDLI